MTRTTPSSASSTARALVTVASVLSSAVIVVLTLFWVSLVALLWTHVALPGRRRRPRAGRRAPRAQGRDRADGDGDHRRLQRGDGDRAPDREPARARLSARQARDRRHLGRVVRPHGGDRAAVRRRAGRSRIRAAARSPRRTAPSGRPTARSSRSRMRTRRGRPTRCASSCRRSPTPTSRTSAGSCGSSPPTARTARACTGATRWACAVRSRGSARSPAATARSTRCAARTTSRSTRASATTSRCRT